MNLCNDVLEVIGKFGNFHDLTMLKWTCKSYVHNANLNEYILKNLATSFNLQWNTHDLKQFIATTCNENFETFFYNLSAEIRSLLPSLRSEHNEYNYINLFKITSGKIDKNYMIFLNFLVSHGLYRLLFLCCETNKSLPRMDIISSGLIYEVVQNSLYFDKKIIMINYLCLLANDKINYSYAYSGAMRLSPLAKAFTLNDFIMMKLLLNKGANVNEMTFFPEQKKIASVKDMVLNRISTLNDLIEGLDNKSSNDTAVQIKIHEAYQERDTLIITFNLNEELSSQCCSIL
ncbi:hypothetical protein [Legionella fallonii]|uniref:Uncharacterized protein n=1 Tax=Legionella fallonii LLAP-10 TaxID=1212491 RepID=A0A098G0F7_9GAMM|nr:hypothetical protein [Legionella fallonii]CEG55992.1 protein of unknown function [Legionella fallonii LLAP-10]